MNTHTHHSSADGVMLAPSKQPSKESKDKFEQQNDEYDVEKNLTSALDQVIPIATSQQLNSANM